VRALRIGMPMGAQFAGEVAFFSSVSFLMGGIGTQMLAAHQVAITISSAPFHVCMGIGSATAVVVGQRIGRGDPSGTLRAGLLGIGTGAVFQAFVGASFLLLPELYLRAFTDDPGVIENGAALVRIAGFFSLSDGVQAVAVGALRGAGDTKWPFLFHIAAHWGFGMPTALLLTFVLGLGAPGLWWGLTCGLTISAVALTARFSLRARSGYAALETHGD
jgi:MATE family multidrug resistance protein